ncbi:MAG: TIGR04076 family protein [Clostridia bacterium]|nr:TIGR04076 family protein [Clostridia bacterium]
MKKVKITVMKTARYDDLIKEFENPISHACDMTVGKIFLANGYNKPENFCDSAWESISPFVLALSSGGEDIYDGWMKNKNSAMISCNDGCRPVSFYLAALDEDAD